MNRNGTSAFWLLIGILLGAFLLMCYAISNGSVILAIILCVGLLTLCCYGGYLSVTQKAKDSEKIRTLQSKTQDEYKDAIAPFYADMQKNYYALLNELRIPADVAKVDVETTVFGLTCKATPTAGQETYYKNDFYMWKDDSTIFIFPTAEHLTDSHIKYRTRTQDLPIRLNPNDISIFKIDIVDVEYYLVTGQELSEFRIEGGGSSGPNIKGAIIGGILAGEAGAIIGGQPEPKPLYSYTQHIENRCVEMVYKHNGLVQKIKLSFPAFSFLERWMPEKDYTYVIANNRKINS